MANTMVNNEIMIRRLGKVVVPHDETSSGKVSDEVLVTFQRNINAYGFVFTGTVINSLSMMGMERLREFHNTLLSIMRNLKGAHVRHEAMYPNFPKQVADASYTELYINAIMHYFGDVIGMRITPEYAKEEREPLDIDFSKFTVLDLGTEEDFSGIFMNILASKSAMSDTDKKDLEWFLRHRSSERIAMMIPANIPNKENMAHFLALLSDKTIVGQEFFALMALDYAKTATDLLRVAVAMSGGHPSLAKSETIRFKTFSRPSRRVFLELLENADAVEEGMLRHKGLWIKFGEKLHPGEYSSKYPRAHRFFSKLRNRETMVTPRAKWENALRDGDVERAVKVLSGRPGEFARSLDRVLSLATKEQEDFVLESFEAVAHKVATNILWQMVPYFRNRHNEGVVRSAYPKGMVAKVQVLERKPKTYREKSRVRVMEILKNTLKTSYASKSELGKVWVDPALKNYTIPTGLRSSSKSLNTVGRGTRIPFSVDEIQRFFVWWKDGSEGDYYRTDLDLSASFYDEDFNHQGEVSYYNMKHGTDSCLHSGDFTSAPDGASEYIDVNVKKLRNEGIRYVAMVVNVYAGPAFNELDECFAGSMGRNKPQAGEIFDARTVEHRFDMNADTRMAVPMVLDLVKGESVWADVAAKSNSIHGANNVASNRGTLSLMVQSIVGTPAADLFDLFSVHGRARGELVRNRKDADVVFHADGSRLSVSAEKILSEYL